MKLPGNVGSIDRVVRLVLGVVFAYLAVGGAVAAPLLYGVWLLAAIMLVTGVVGFCPLYAVFGVSTAGNRVTIGRRAKA